MIVLGRKYKFTDFEKQRLEKKFNKQLIIKYRGRDPFEVLSELKTLLDKTDVSMVVLNTKATVPDELIKYLTKLRFERNIKLITIESFMEEYLEKCYIPEDHTDLNYLQNIKPFNFFEYSMKRVVDYLGAITLGLISAPIMMYSKKRIEKESPGSLIFRQTRVGVKGKLFYCNKFRSMHENSHHDKYTRENDTRIFPWGNTMRKTRIDELPQIINVLKGDMHFIGPRAEWNILVEEYETQLPYYNERHLVRPGITGWAQVNYPYGANLEDTKQKLMYDLYYIKHYSLWLDIKIIWKTIMVVLGRKGL
ncbi:sugar transferase [Arcobacter vandammei]|uniref:sugar transferase n=1 Tax=Arcobacter vandammei TaxID=2782243 RepID=UPI0018DFDB14|nr:sugar transferase [Arcobacter vandammei]